MHNCASIDPLVTPFVDGHLAPAEHRAVEDHLRACPPCHSRVAAERAVHDLLRAQRPTLCTTDAPDALHMRCAALAANTDDGRRRAHELRTELRTSNDNLGTLSRHLRTRNLGTPNPEPQNLRTSNAEPRTPSRRLVPYALAASLVTIVGGAFLYQATAMSPKLMAAQLVADHERCFSGVGGDTRVLASAVEQSLASTFDWRVHLPDGAATRDLELVGERTCLYGDGRVAHIMYRHQGRPMSLFMLPHSEHAQELIEVFGHEAAIWCANNRTFVLIAREPRKEVERMASLVQTALH